jgi:hypothetical protein
MNKFRLKEEQKRFLEGERQELEARLAPIKAEVTAQLKKAESATRLYWSQPLRVLASFTNRGDFQPDLGCVFPSTDEQQGGSRGRAEFEKFVNQTLSQTGLLLSPAGSQRLLYFVLAQAFSENKADMATPATWQIAFDRLNELRCFNEEGGELGYDESQRVVEPVVEQPKPEPGIEALEGLNLLRREDEAQARALIANEVFNGEAKTVFRQFIAHVLKTFGHELTPDEQREIILWFTNNNRSFLDHKAYDACRVNLVRRGILPPGCLTEDEQLTNSIEDEDTTTWQGRRNLKQELIAARRRS